MRKFLCAAVVTLVAYSLAGAENYFGRVTSIEDRTVTFKGFKKGEFKKGAGGMEYKIKLAKDATILKGGEFDKEEKKFTGGDKLSVNEAATYVKDAKEGRGRGAIIVTKGEGADERITSIRFTKGKGGKGGKGKKNPDTE